MTSDSATELCTGRHADRVECEVGNVASHGAFLAVSAPEAMRTGFDIVRAAPAVSEGGGGNPTGQRARRMRVGSQQLQAMQQNLSDRDWHILDSLTMHPFLTTFQIQRLHFADHASTATGHRVCRRVLSRLAAIRAIEHLERRIGGVRAGSASFVWRLGPVGDRLLRHDVARDDGPRLRRKEPSLRYLDHCLAVAETHIRLLEAGRDHAPDLLRLQTEPTCWRPYATLGGGQAVLKPDLFAVTATDDFEDSWFIEVDRGTESVPTLLRKCTQYEEYRRSGVEQRDRGVFPLVLWLLPNDRRREAFAAGLHKPTSLDRSIFRLATADELISAVTGATDPPSLEQDAKQLTERRWYDA
jgi:Replication-relaxation